MAPLLSARPPAPQTDFFCNVLLFTNACLLGSRAFGEPDHYVALGGVTDAFTFAFAAEVLLRMRALGGFGCLCSDDAGRNDARQKRARDARAGAADEGGGKRFCGGWFSGSPSHFTHYWSDGWNLLDVVSVGGALVAMLTPSVLPYASNYSHTLIAFRTFRLFRILTVVTDNDAGVVEQEPHGVNLRNKFRGLLQNLRTQSRSYISTMVACFVPMINITGLLMLVLFVYAATGVQLFAHVKRGRTPFPDGGGSVDSHTNFASMGAALLTLARCITGEAWPALMHELADDSDCNPNFATDLAAGGPVLPAADVDGCGTPIAYLYFVSFTLIVGFVFMNLFVVAVLEGFDGTVRSGTDASRPETRSSGMSGPEYAQLCADWQAVDPTLSWSIDSARLRILVHSLAGPVADDLEASLEPEAALKVIRQVDARLQQVGPFRDVTRTAAMTWPHLLRAARPPAGSA